MIPADPGWIMGMEVCVLVEVVVGGGEAKGRRTPPSGILVALARDWEEGRRFVVIWNKWVGIWTVGSSI